MAKSILFLIMLGFLFHHYVLFQDAGQNPLNTWIEIKAFSSKWETPADINIGFLISEFSYKVGERILTLLSFENALFFQFILWSDL